MKTPAGRECSYFYGDYHRGRSIEECRLLKLASPPQNWRPALCETCPVPDIERANSCKHQSLAGRVERPFLIGRPRVVVSAYCTKSSQPVEDPHIGCGQCHFLPKFLIGEPGDPDDSR